MMESLAGLDLAALVQTYALPWGIRLLSALAIVIVGRWVAGWLTGLARRLLERTGLDEILTRFFTNILHTLLIVVVAIAALDRLGVQTTSLLAILGAAGLAVGLALKDSLSNFAAGVMLIFFRPFRAGDFIEAAGTSGLVESVNMFNTVLLTGDNRQIIVPNSQIYSGIIVNVTARDRRRIDLVIGIGYDDDIAQARELLTEILRAHPKVMEDPAPTVALAELGASSMDFNVRGWVKTGDYWGVRSELLETIKQRFDTAGINIPYPQQDVHLYRAGGS